MISFARSRFNSKNISTVQGQPNLFSNQLILALEEPNTEDNDHQRRRREKTSLDMSPNYQDTLRSQSSPEPVNSTLQNIKRNNNNNNNCHEVYDKNIVRNTRRSTPRRSKKREHGSLAHQKQLFETQQPYTLDPFKQLAYR